MSNKQSYDEKRQISRIGLRTFYTNYQSNHFDSLVNKTIKQLEKEKQELQEKNKEDIKKHFMTQMQIYLVEKELFSMSEMRVLYAYKHFETHLKWLISASYGIEEKKLFRWEFVMDYMNSKKIDLSKFSNYSQIKDLQNLNNSIKHSRNLINSKTQNIIEFRGRKSVNFRIMGEFYERIKDSPKDFLFELTEKIENDLYEFDNERLDAMTKKIAERMDVETMREYIQRLEKITKHNKT